MPQLPGLQRGGAQLLHQHQHRRDHGDTHQVGRHSRTAEWLSINVKTFVPEAWNVVEEMSIISCSISVSSSAFRANARLRFRPMQLLLFLLPFRVDKLIFSIKLHILYFLLCYNHFLFHSDAALTRATDSPYFCWEAFPRWQSWFRWDLRPKLENSSSSKATSNGQYEN